MRIGGFVLLLVFLELSILTTIPLALGGSVNNFWLLGVPEFYTEKYCELGLF